MAAAGRQWQWTAVAAAGKFQVQRGDGHFWHTIRPGWADIYIKRRSSGPDKGACWPFREGGKGVLCTIDIQLSGARQPFWARPDDLRVFQGGWIVVPYVFTRV